MSQLLASKIEITLMCIKREPEQNESAEEGNAKLYSIIEEYPCVCAALCALMVSKLG